MKTKLMSLMLFVCSVLVSCETLGMNVEDIVTPSQTNSSGSSQSGTSLSSKQNDPNRRAHPDAANWDISALDTAAAMDYLSSAEKDVILEMNKARSDPKKYAKF